MENWDNVSKQCLKVEQIVTVVIPGEGCAEPQMAVPPMEVPQKIVAERQTGLAGPLGYLLGPPS